MLAWLTLHGVSAEQMRSLVDRSGTIRGPRRDVSPDTRSKLGPDEVWECCATALRLAVPAAEQIAKEALSRVMVNVNPDRNRYPRAFTLHDAGNGAPYVSCPWDGRIVDAVTLSHEFGHAAQILASADREVPPILREAFAHLTEHLFARQLNIDGHPQAGDIADYARQNALAMAVHYGPRLRRALSESSAQYEYGWNYPPALALSDALGKEPDPERLWTLINGSAEMPELIAATGL